MGGPFYQVTAQSNAGLDYNVSVYDTESVCSAFENLAGWALSFTAAGTCTILAVNYGNADWTPAQAEQSFTVKAAQSVSFTSTPTQPTVGTTYSVAATASSGDPVTFSIDSGSATFCSLSGTVVSFTATGECLIYANTPGDATYGPAYAFQSFEVGGEPQAVAFSSIAPQYGVVGGQTYTPAATANSGLPVTFTTYGFFDGTTIPVCYMSGSVLVFHAVGTCQIVAVQAGNDIYASATAKQSFTVVLPPVGTPQTIAFTSTPPSGAVFEGPTYIVSAAGGGSGNPVTFTSSTSSVCQIGGETVSFVGAGRCIVDANQAGGSNYSAATEVQQSFAVAPATQTISWPSIPTSGTFGGNTTLSANGGGSHNPVVFSIDRTSGSGVCSVQDTNGTHLSYTGVGTCVVDANQAGDADYSAAPQVRDSFPVTICSGSETRCFTSAASTSVPVGSQLSFPVKTAGSPTPKITEKGTLPKGVTFNGSTDILGGVPTSTKHKSAVGIHPLTFTATFGKGKGKIVVTQAFTLSVT